MGNTASNKVPETVGGAYSPTARDENVYDQSFPPGPPTSRYTASSQTQSPPSYASLRVSPPVPPRMDRRSYTVTSRPEKHSDSPRTNHTALRRQSTSDVSHVMSSASSSSDSDDLSTHVTKVIPQDEETEVALDFKITVYFDRDVRAVNIDKLFEVHCNSVDPSLNPVKGRISYDARQQRAEFIPHNTLYPNSKYTIILIGRAVTTTQCSNSTNIKNAKLHFYTCSPSPKNIGIKLKGQGQEPDNIQIANYYDLYNSLIVWSTRKWGCSGEYITGMYTENGDGKLLPLKADHDVLNLKENEIVVVEIKD